MRILIAEDNKAISLVISRIVGELGHDFCIAADGDQALTLFQQRAIDLVFLDVEMPGKTGYEVLEEIRTQRREWIPVIFISAHTDNKSLNRGLMAGADDYLFKPVNHLLLQTKIRLFERVLKAAK